MSFDPNALADQLDALLPPGNSEIPDGGDDPLIAAARRLAAAPRPALSPEALARIQLRMDAAWNAPPAPRFSLQTIVIVIAVIAIIAALIVIGTQIIAPMINLPAATATDEATHTPLATLTSTATPSVTPSATFTLTASVTASPTATPTVEATLVPANSLAGAVPTLPQSVIASVTPTNTDTPTNTITPTETPTAAPTDTPTSSATAAPTHTTTAEITAELLAPTTPPALLVIEGPVQAVTGNIITIYNVNIALDPAEPLLAAAQVGQRVRIEGEWTSSTNTIIAVTIYVISIDVVLTNGGVIVWQDAGNCQNPPPPWAPANGWRARCEGGGGRRGGVIIRNGAPSVDGQNGGSVGGPDNPPPPPPPSEGGDDDDD